jgi:hypothetical protein
LAFFPRFGLAGAASGLAATGSGATIRPSFSTHSQILLAAVLESFSAFTGFTPGRLLKVATQRSAGQLASSSASSCWSVNKSKGVVLAAAAVANAVMPFSSSMVRIFIVVSPWLPRSARSCTWITLFGPEGKAFVQENRPIGEGLAMPGRRPV